MHFFATVNQMFSSSSQLLTTAIHCLFVWIVLNDLITACSAEGKGANILLMVVSVHVIERHSKAHGTQFCENSQIQEQGFHRGPLYTERVH